jgi:NADPH-dependent curcumin reductase CurA
MSTAIGVLGITGYTAYFGLELARPRPGDRILVSGAVGGVGSSVGQIATISGCAPVIAVCGGPEKQRLAVERLGYTHALDYRADDFEQALDAAMPEGIDIYFDNTGGRILELALTGCGRARGSSFAARSLNTWPTANRWGHPIISSSLMPMPRCTAFRSMPSRSLR